MHELRQEKDNLSSLKWRTTPSWHTLFNSYNYGPFLMLCNYANTTVQKSMFLAHFTSVILSLQSGYFSLNGYFGYFSVLSSVIFHFLRSSYNYKRRQDNEWIEYKYRKNCVFSGRFITTLKKRFLVLPRRRERTDAVKWLLCPNSEKQTEKWLILSKNVKGNSLQAKKTRWIARGGESVTNALPKTKVLIELQNKTVLCFNLLGHPVLKNLYLKWSKFQGL